MALTSDDYEGVRVHLRYPYSDLSTLTSVLDTEASEYGINWVTKLQDLLGLLDTAQTTLTSVLGNPEIKIAEVTGEYQIEYQQGKSALTAANSYYNKLVSDLVLLTGITVNSINTKIIRGS